jgi:aspartate aminotransferase
MMKLAKRMATAKPSAVVQVSDKVRDLQKQGRKIISFSIGVPNFLPAKHVYEAAHKAVDGDSGAYLPGRGSEELVSAFIKRMSANGLDYKPSEVAAAVGGKHALFNILMAILDDGDEVLIPSPYWTSYPDMVELLGGSPVFMNCPASQNYKLKPKQIAGAVTKKTKAIIFNNPSNPTGMVYTRDEIKALGDELEKHNIIIISDDIYDRMVFDGEKFHHLLHTNPKLRDRTVIVQSVSKNYGMPGWRVGMVAAPEALIKALLTLSSAQVTNINNVSMAAAAAAFDGPQDFSDAMMPIFAAKRDKVMTALATVPAIKCPKPQGAFYAFPDVSAFYGKTYKGKKITDDIALCTLLLEEKDLALVPGSAFGDGNGVRISYACKDDQLDEGLKRFVAFFKEVEAENTHAA